MVCLKHNGFIHNLYFIGFWNSRLLLGGRGTNSFALLIVRSILALPERLYFDFSCCRYRECHKQLAEKL